MRACNLSRRWLTPRRSSLEPTGPAPFVQNCRVLDTRRCPPARPGLLTSRFRLASLVAALAVAALVLSACGSSSDEEPLIAPSDEEALAEDALENAGPPAPGEEESEPPLDADAVDEVVPDGELVVVARVVDGDTLELDDGRRVGLVQIDAPEGGEDKECYADEARDSLRSYVDRGGEVLLVGDPLLDEEDEFGRLLRYVHVDSENLNVELVRRGSATVWFFDGQEGIFATELLEASTVANEMERGLWGACPGTPFDPRGPADTGPA